MQQAAASAPSASRAAAAVRVPWPSALSELAAAGRTRRREQVVRVDEAELPCDVAEARGLYQFDEVLVFHFCAVHSERPWRGVPVVQGRWRFAGTFYAL